MMDSPLSRRSSFWHSPVHIPPGNCVSTLDVLSFVVQGCIHKSHIQFKPEGRLLDASAVRPQPNPAVLQGSRYHSPLHQKQAHLRLGVCSKHKAIAWRMFWETPSSRPRLGSCCHQRESPVCLRIGEPNIFWCPLGTALRRPQIGHRTEPQTKIPKP